MANEVLDIFNGTGFTMSTLTQGINKIAPVYSRLGALGIFEDEGVTTRSVIVEELNGCLQLVRSKKRGEVGDKLGREDRKLRSISVPHMPLKDRIEASDISGVRAFNSGSQLETANAVMARKLARMRQSHELTEEWLRIGAIKGVVLDGDGSTTLLNLFTAFEMPQPTAVDFALGTDTTAVDHIALQVKREVEGAINGMPYQYIHAMCGAAFFDKLSAHPVVAWSLQWVNQNENARNDQRRGFYWKGILWEEYTASVGGIPFIASGDCRFFPVGVPGLFKTYMAPMEDLNLVNTIGVRVYAKQKIDEWQEGIDVKTESNVLPVCTRPSVLIRGYTSN